MIADAKGTDIHVFPVETPFVKNIPDMYAKHPEYPGCWIELKFDKRVSPKAGSQTAVDLTSGQRRWMRDEQRAGGCAGWAMCIRFSKDHFWRIFAGTDPDVETVDQTKYLMDRRKGELWQITPIIHLIATQLKLY